MFLGDAEVDRGGIARGARRRVLFSQCCSVHRLKRAEGLSVEMGGSHQHMEKEEASWRWLVGQKSKEKRMFQ